MKIRKGTENDLLAVAQIYEAIHDGEERGDTTIGWIRHVYPTLDTAKASHDRGDLFVMEEEGSIIGAAIINQQQVDVYADGDWQHDAPDDEVMVLHTLVIDPKCAGRGYGRAFVGFYEDYARQNGCACLRMDTNARNLRARAMYGRLGYEEIGVIPTCFNGIAGVNLVLLEKKL